MISANMENNLKEYSESYIGEKLYDKTIANGNKWHIIILNDSQKKYGTGWNYIPEGTNINNYGATKKQWLANFNTGEIVELEKDKYTDLSYESGLAVTEGLVFNVDATNIQDSNSWGDGVKLYGFNNNPAGSLYDGNALKFDGIDDYISIDGNLNVSDEITLEFYGSVSGYSNDEYSFIPILDAYNGRRESTDGACMRMYILGRGNNYYNNRICTNFGYENCGNSSIWENEGATHNLVAEGDIKLNGNEMFTITYNHKKLTYSVYQNGILLKEAKLNSLYWENFKNNDIPKIEYFRIGRTRWNGITGYYNGLIYSIRIYNKALTSDEVLENYNKTVLYHNLGE